MLLSGGYDTWRMFNSSGSNAHPDVIGLVQGLTVQLHPYQRQALQFMLDNECLERGSQSLFWCCLLQLISSVIFF